MPAALPRLASLFAATATTALFACAGAAHGGEIETYPLPSIYPESPTFDLKVDGQPVPVVGYTGHYDYAHFSLNEGPVEVEITVPGREEIGGFNISPRKLGIQGEATGNTLRFTLEGDEYLIVKIDGVKELVIAADPPETDKPSASGRGVFNVLDDRYGADPTGQELNTEAFRRAVEDAARYADGQGIVYVPAGLYLVGNVRLESDVALYLEGGSVLRFTANPEDYEIHWHKDSQNRDITWWVYTRPGSENIKVYGRGTMDGNGRYAAHDRDIGNNILVPIETSGFTFDGPIIRESGSWAVTPIRSDNLVFRNLKLFNRFDQGENDGIDVVESQDVLVQHAIGIALDDPFSTKAWGEDTDIAVSWGGDPEPVQRVVIDDTVSWTYCYGYKLGQGVIQPQSDITFKNGVVYDASVGIGIHHRYGQAPADNITFENIEVERLSYVNDSKRTWMSFFIDDRYREEAGQVSDVLVKDVVVHDRGRTPAILHGYSPSTIITGVTFDNVRMPGSSTPATTLHEMNVLNRVHYEDVTILPVQEPEPAQRENIALGGMPSASSTESGSAERAIDADWGTRWASDRSDPQWLAVDLGEEHAIDGVKIGWEVAYGRAYRVQVSPDGSSWTTVYETDASDGDVDEIDFEPVNARHVRVLGEERATRYGYSIWEFEVYAAEDAAS